MQMRPVAAGLASLGRGDDKMLVHMTPGEVAGLQTLAMKHGGSLTINPHTGLPEAGFLSSMLPTLAGAALNVAFPGSGLLIGAGIGGLTALTSGSLKKGLMAGLGAYGGAGLGAAFSNAGLNAFQEAALKGTPDALAEVAGGYGASPAFSYVPPGAVPEAALSSGLPTIPAGQEVPDVMSEISGGYGASPSTVYKAPSVTPPAVNQELIKRTAAENWAKMDPLERIQKSWEAVKSGGVDFKRDIIGQAADKDKKTEKTGLGGWGGAALTAGAAAAPLVGYGLDEANRRALNQQRDAAERARTGQTSSYYHASFNPGVYNPQTGMFEQRAFGPGYSSPSFAMGGTVPNLNQMYPQSDITRATYATSPQDPRPSEVVDGYAPKIDPFTMDQRLAKGGIAGVHHEYKAGGRLLDGPGDGMSDDIPAVIKGPQPQRAALADGEFVVPADVVSHLGNGSTKAGAKHLYRMMDKVRMARVGTKQQGRQIRAEKFLPA